MERVEKALLIAFITAMIVLVVVAVCYRFASGQPVHGTPEPLNVIYLLGMLLAFLYLTTAIANLVFLLGRDRHERFASILRPLEKDLYGDADFLARLGFSTSRRWSTD
jgi:hypothetical protein